MPRTSRPPQPVAVDLTRFLPMFFQETEEHLAAMEGQLLHIDLLRPDPEVLNSIFRAAHSIKGNSTIFGATRMADVMHRIETILDRVRKEELRPDRDMVSLLLEACDAVRDELRALRNGNTADPAVLQALDERLVRLARVPAGAPGELADSPPLAPMRSERIRVRVQLPEERGIAGLPLAELYAELGKLGRVEDVEVGTADSGAATLSLFLLTPETQKTVRARLVSLLGTDNVRVDLHPPASRSPTTVSTSPTDDLREAAGPAYGLFAESSHDSGYQGFGGSATHTGTFQSSALGRRSIDHDPAASSFGRRPTDRPYFDRSSIRVDVDKVDRLLNLVGELIIAQSMLAEAAERSGARQEAGLGESIANVGRQTRELQEAVMSIRMLPLDFLFSRMPRLIRDLAHKLDKDVELLVQGGETELDKELIEKLADPLMHLVRNSLDHGIELPAVREGLGKSRRGSLQLRAMHRGGEILIEVEDDGAGFDRDKILRKAAERGLPADPRMSDEEVWQLVFAPGFTTAEAVSDVSGRGVGLDVVKRNVRALSGHVEVRSGRGEGVTIAIRVPLTLAILDGVTVEIGGETLIVPLSSICEAFLSQAGQIKSIASGPQVVQIRESYVPLLDLQSLLGIGREGVQTQPTTVLVVEAEGQRAAFAVGRLLGQQQVVIKTLEANYRRVRGIAGATVLGNGRVALILDVNGLLRTALASIKNLETLARAQA